MMEYTISYKEMLSSEQNLAYSWVWFIYRTPDSCLIQLWIFIHHAYVFIRQITIMIQNKFLCHSVPVSLCAHVKPLQNSNSYRNETKHPARRQHAPRPSNLVSKTFVTRKSITNIYCTVLHHFSIASLLQEKVTPCCDLPKETTFPLHRLDLLNSNSQI
jgi:hypothetical protein